MRNVAIFSVMVPLLCLVAGQGCPPHAPTDPHSVAPTSIGGTIEVTSLSIPAGQTTIVTSDLVINATGDVKIDGELTAQPTESGAAGCTITINAGGDIDIAGFIEAGSGTDAATATPTMRIAAAAEDTDACGTAGGSIELIAKGNITIGQMAVLICGSGGTGADGAWGGAGGKGGDLVIDAGGTLTMNGIIYIGDGGDSGFCTPTVQTVQSLAPDQELSLGATGGSSGFIYLRAGQVNWLSYEADTHSLDYFYASVGGGQAGNASSVTIFGDVAIEIMAASGRATPCQASAPTYICSGTTCKFRAPNGVDGSILGGLGGDIDVKFDQLEANQWDAPAIIVYAGHGGNLVSPPSYKYKDALAVLMRNGWAGAGGSAFVAAANGHDGTASRSGGKGGDAVAYAGNGGSAAHITYSPQHGGSGGVATAVAGSGGHGYSDTDCAIPGGNGGNGGSAYAYGGDGGNGWYAGQGGNALAQGGFGGFGGSGASAGSGGKGGGATAAGGEAGQSNTDATGGAIIGSLATQRPGMDGGDGAACE